MIYRGLEIPAHPQPPLSFRRLPPSLHARPPTIGWTAAGAGIGTGAGAEEDDWIIMMIRKMKARPYPTPAIIFPYLSQMDLTSLVAAGAGAVADTGFGLGVVVMVAIRSTCKIVYYLYRWYRRSMKVHRYTSPTDKIEYDIQIPIFPDDTISTVITKIALDINNQENAKGAGKSPVDMSAQPYIWNSKKALGFEISPKPTSVNPWEAKQDVPDKYNINRFTEDIFYSVHNPQGWLKVAFINDVPAGIRSHPAFFPDKAKWKIGEAKMAKKEYDRLNKETAVLKSIWDAGRSYDTTVSNNEQQESVSYRKVTFVGDLNTSVDLVELYNSINPTKHIPFAQFVFDEMKIMYKIAKQSDKPFSPALFKQFTSFELIPKIQGVIILVPMILASELQKEKVPGDYAYARVVIDSAGKLAFHYKINQNVRVDLKDFTTNNAMILQWLRLSVPLHISSLSARIRIKNTTNSGIEDLQNKIGKEMVQVFHIEQLKSGTNNNIDVIYKRSVNYKSDLDVVDNIKSQINLGIPLQEIKENLITNLGLTADDANGWIEQYMAYVETQQRTINNGDKPQKKKFLSTGCIVNIKSGFNEFNVLYDNLGSIEELHNATRWLTGAIELLPPKKAAHKHGGPAQAVALEPVVAKASSSASASASVPAPGPVFVPAMPTPDIDFDLDYDSEGGAVGKKLSGYFLNKMKERDADLFSSIPGYARSCGATTFKQPISVTQKEMKEIQDKGYASSISDSIEYRNNHYFCPLLWCDKENIPITPDELVEVNGKKVCPGPDAEEPIDLRHKNFATANPKPGKPTHEKHIYFINDRPGWCLPCCGKKKWIGVPKWESEITKCKAGPKVGSPKASKDNSAATARPSSSAGPSHQRPVSVVEQKNFIITTAAPITEGRFGAIPEDLHNIMTPDLPYDKCKSLTSTPCVVRIGINHGKDSIMNAVAFCMKTNKDGLIQRIKKNLDPLTFLSLDNGHVVQRYLPVTETPIDAGTIKEAQRWADRFPHTAKLFAESEPMAIRLGAIYRAYLNLIQSLDSNEPKTIPLVTELMAILNVTMIVFEKTGYETAEVYCPPRFNANGKQVILLLKEENYFEPLVGKARNINALSIFDSREFPELITFIADSCQSDASGTGSYRTFVEAFRGLKQWIDYSLVSNGNLSLQTAIIRPDLRLHGFLTRGNIMLVNEDSGLPLSVLPEVVKIAKIKKVMFMEDLPLGPLNVASGIPLADVELLNQKINGIGLKIQTEIDHRMIYQSYYPAIRINTETPKIRDKDRQWYQIKMAVLDVIIKHYDTLVEPLNKREPREQRNILVKTFKKLTDPVISGSKKTKDVDAIRREAKEREAIVYAVLEQMPLREGYDAILRWRRMDYADPKWVSDNIHENKRYWEFSQLAVAEGIPGYVISRESHRDEVKNVVIEPKTANIPVLKFVVKGSDTEVTQLPTKWRTESFAKFKILKTKYSKDTFSKLTEWLSAHTSVPVTWKDVQYIAERQLINQLSSSGEPRKTLLKDNSILHFLKTRLNPSLNLKNAAEITEALGSDPRRTLTRVFAAHASELWPSDDYLAVMAKLLDMTILLIGRAAYSSKTQERGRGNDSDRIVSSTIFTGSSDNWKDRPIIFLYKESASADPSHTIYRAVLDNYDTFYNPTYHHLDNDVQKLVNAVYKASRE